METEQDNVSDAEVIKLLAKGIRGRFFVALLDEPIKVRIQHAMEKAYSKGYNDAVRDKDYSERTSKPADKWYIDHKEEWLCDSCFEWVPARWKHACRLIVNDKYKKIYEYKNKSPNGNVTIRKKRK
jgi:hypothetical protein